MGAKFAVMLVIGLVFMGLGAYAYDTYALKAGGIHCEEADGSE